MNYKDIHDKIIEKAKKENRSKGDGNYYEAHHIVPKCMGGKGKVSEWRTHPNIVLLTAKEHFVIHKLLCEIYPDNNKLIHAYWMFSTMKNKQHINYRVGCREYERLRIKKSKIMSESIVTEETKQKHRENTKGEKNPFYNKKHSEETIQKISGENNHMFGKTGEKHPMFNKKRSEKSIQKQRESRIGKYNREKSPSAKKVICTVTGKIYGCIKDASEDLGITYKNLSRYLNGSRMNKTTLQLLIHSNQ